MLFPKDTLKYMECVIFVTLLVQHFLADISKHEKGTC